MRFVFIWNGNGGDACSGGSWDDQFCVCIHKIIDVYNDVYLTVTIPLYQQHEPEQGVYSMWLLTQRLW